MALNISVPSVAGIEKTQRVIILDPKFFADSALIYPPTADQPVIVATGHTEVRLYNLGTLVALSVGQDSDGTALYTIRTALTFQMWEDRQLSQPDVVLSLAPRS